MNFLLVEIWREANAFYQRVNGSMPVTTRLLETAVRQGRLIVTTTVKGYGWRILWNILRISTSG